MKSIDELVGRLLEQARMRGRGAEEELQRQIDEASREGQWETLRVTFGDEVCTHRRMPDGSIQTTFENLQREARPRPEGGDVLIGGKPADWDGYKFVSQKEEPAGATEEVPVAVHLPKEVKQCPVCYQHTLYESKADGWVCISEVCDRGGRAARLGFDVAEARRRAARAAELDPGTLKR